MLTKTRYTDLVDKDMQIELRRVLQQGLPLTSRPYLTVAEQLGCDEATVIALIKEFQDQELIKRFGMIVRHHELGYTANCMVVWNIPEARIEEVGHKLSQQPEVTLCYQRPRRLPDWPFNLFCMLHGKCQQQVKEQIDNIIDKYQFEFEYQLLFSTRRFKQTGGRYV